jgi:hypothetical protein
VAIPFGEQYLAGVQLAPLAVSFQYRKLRVVQPGKDLVVTAAACQQIFTLTRSFVAHEVSN